MSRSKNSGQHYNQLKLHRGSWEYFEFSRRGVPNLQVRLWPIRKRAARAVDEPMCICETPLMQVVAACVSAQHFPPASSGHLQECVTLPSWAAAACLMRNAPIMWAMVMQVHRLHKSSCACLCAPTYHSQGTIPSPSPARPPSQKIWGLLL